MVYLPTFGGFLWSMVGGRYTYTSPMDPMGNVTKPTRVMVIW